MSKKRKGTKRRLQRSLDKRKRRQASAKTRRPPVIPGLSDFTEEDCLFWCAHGVNYLVSDYEKGIWDPLFDDLYEGRMPTLEAIRMAVLKRHQTLDGKITVRGQAIYAWTCVDKSVVYLFAKEVLRAVRKADPQCDAKIMARKPRQSTVWKLFQSLWDRTYKSKAGENS